MNHDQMGVILDGTPGDHEGFERHLLESMGHQVTVCHGPGDAVCPLLEEGACEEVDRAHGVVFKLDLEREYHRRILEQYERTLPADMPIAVAVQPGQETTYAGQPTTHAPPAPEPVHADRRPARSAKASRAASTRVAA